MTIKSILFCLFLYVCLVWVGAEYLESGPDIEKFGLLWTAAGLGAALAFIVLSRLWSYWGLLRAKLPKPGNRPRKAAAALNEDEMALAALLAEANATLQRSENYAAKNGISPLSKFPLYLLAGPEAAGKTSTFLNSGLEPQLLAGRAAGAAPVLPTQLCNIWLARNAVFVEISGRIFADPVRWSGILQALRAKPALPRWRRLWQTPEPDISLRGVVAMCEAKEFMAAATPQGRERIERQAQEWGERLGVVGETFGRRFPVYLLVTKADSIPYFTDYFRRVKDPEAGQTLGCTLPQQVDASQLPAEAEVKRLTRAFAPFYRSLAERRLLQLAHESDVGRRSGIYEFPRELKRIRSPLVQFMVDVFRQRSLRPGAVLRGFYFTGTREEEEVMRPLAGGGSLAGQSLDDASVIDATILFRGDATQIFRPDDASRVSVLSRSARARRWLFAGELFDKVILADHFAAVGTLPDLAAERLRKLVFASVCTVCLLGCGALVASWAANARLLNSLQQAESLQGSGRDASLAALRTLETLRTQLSRLTTNERDGAPLRMRWGLYSGNAVLPEAKRLYFRRFQEVLLNNLDAAMTGRLAMLPAAPGPNDPYEPAFSLLKTHLTVSSGSCKPEPALVAKVLRETLHQVQPDAGSEWHSLADRQIDLYASELPHGNPCHLAGNDVARNHAREYLRHVQGADRMYAQILSASRKKITKPIRLADLAANFQRVMSGQPEVDGAFSKEGWAFVQEAAQKDSGSPTADACVTGDADGFLDTSRHSADMRRAIQQLYVRDYIERWRGFIASFSVTRYNGPADAARRLELLADHKSPLLAVFALTSNQTNFPAMADEPTGIARMKPYINKLFPATKTLPKTIGQAAAGQTGLSLADITRSFQPVHVVVPPGSETWVVDKNSPYIDSLADLGRVMQAIADGGVNPDPAVHQAANQSYEKAVESARQIAKGFEPMGVDGLDVAVQHLLEAPIRMAQGFIIRDVDNAGKQKVNGELRAFCSHLRPFIRKYPFSQSGEDASLEEVAAWFAPGTGAIWKFQTQSLAELTVKDGPSWKAKDPAKKMQVTPELITFLNRAEAITGAFYANGSAQPQLSYILRPKLDASFNDAVIEFEVDGQRHQWTSTLQKQFTWPASPLGKDAGARGRIRTASLAFPFASRGGLWGIFHMMGDAEPRLLGSKLIEWKYVRGGDGRLEPIQPTPVRLEIVEFPGGADLFNPRFYDGLQCPATAAQ